MPFIIHEKEYFESLKKDKSVSEDRVRYLEGEVQKTSTKLKCLKY